MSVIKQQDITFLNACKTLAKTDFFLSIVKTVVLAKENNCGTFEEVHHWLCDCFFYFKCAYFLDQARLFHIENWFMFYMLNSIQARWCYTSLRCIFTHSHTFFPEDSVCCIFAAPLTVECNHTHMHPHMCKSI